MANQNERTPDSSIGIIADLGDGYRTVYHEGREQPYTAWDGKHVLGFSADHKEVLAMIGRERTRKAML